MKNILRVVITEGRNIFFSNDVAVKAVMPHYDRTGVLVKSYETVSHSGTRNSNGCFRWNEACKYLLPPPGECPHHLMLVLVDPSKQNTIGSVVLDFSSLLKRGTSEAVGWYECTYEKQSRGEIHVRMTYTPATLTLENVVESGVSTVTKPPTPEARGTTSPTNRSSVAYAAETDASFDSAVAVLPKSPSGRRPSTAQSEQDIVVSRFSSDDTPPGYIRPDESEDNIEKAFAASMSHSRPMSRVGSLRSHENEFITGRPVSVRSKRMWEVTPMVEIA
mmetsp:Transcript_45621/g.74371  ORF Transcript_45621/g.74371 Transcript_45621/m.74371 type:complete len:276 (-) Transcript_45621:534-1361(-)